MTRDESLINIQNNQYSGGGSGAMNLMYFAFGNPITDSMVVNSFAKTNSASFQMGLKTGIYNNHTILGGNFLYNSLNNNKYTGRLFKNSKSGSVQPFKNIKFLGENSKLRNLSFNFLSSKDIEGTAVTNLADKTGLNKTSEIVRTGWGFGKDYSGFFGALNDIGYSADVFNDKTVEKIEAVSKKVKNSKRAKYKRNIKVGKKSKISNEINNAVEIKNKGYHVVTENVTKQETIKGISWNSANLSDDVIKNIMSATDEQVITLADEYLNIGGTLTKYSKGTKVITNEIKEELVGAIGKTFASRTTFQKIISNPLVRVATGAAIALPAAVSIPLAAITTGAGIIASVGQDNAINNFINSNLYNETQYDRYSSDEAMSSLYSATNIRDANLQALANAYRNINVANRYLNDMDAISSDYKYTLDDAETS